MLLPSIYYRQHLKSILYLEVQFDSSGALIYSKIYNDSLSEGGENLNQKQLVSFLSFWVANTVVILVSSAVLKGNVVLGNDKVSPSLAAIIAGLVLTVITTFTPQVVEKSGFKLKDEKFWALIFLAVNFVGLWAVKRLAVLTGLGISSILWVLILAVVVTLVQWGVAQLTGAMSKTKKG